MRFKQQTRFFGAKNNRRNSRHTFSISAKSSARKISLSIRQYFQCTAHRLVTPVKIWWRSVVTAAPSFPREFSKHVCVQGLEQRGPANSPSERFATAKWISPRL